MEENFDDMSNDQLRLKLLQYGFTNMPVTSTTRKVLIKKLKNTIVSDMAKVRRETIHVAKYSSDEDAEPKAAPAASKKSSAKKEPSSNRRATIGGASMKLPKPVPASQNAPSTAVLAPPVPPPVVTSVTPLDFGSASTRRSGRITPTMGRGAADAPAKSAVPQEPPILEDSDDDMIPLTKLKQRSRQSKSPSLSRADMLTTSYIHQVEVKPSVEAIVEEMEIDFPDTEKDAEEEIETIMLDDYDDIEEDAASSIPPPLNPPQPKPLEKESFNTNTGSQFNYRRTMAAPERPVNEGPFSSVKYGNIAAAAEPQSKPSITTPARVSLATNRRDETGPRYDLTDSPYLSEFTKRLSRLRAEAVQQPPSGDYARKSPSRTSTMTIPEKGFTESSAALRPSYASKDAYEASSSRYRPSDRYKFSPSAKSSVSKAEDIRSSIRQTLLELDQKYSIRKKFYAVVIALVVVFLFVFFFM